MRYSLSVLLLFIGNCSGPSGIAFGRVWSNASGAYELEAETISFDDSMVVLKKPTGELVAIELKDLSTQDQEYVRSKEAKDTERKAADEMQTWMSKDGMKVRGRDSFLLSRCSGRLRKQFTVGSVPRQTSGHHRSLVTIDASLRFG